MAFCQGALMCRIFRNIQLNSVAGLRPLLLGQCLQDGHRTRQSSSHSESVNSSLLTSPAAGVNLSLPVFSGPKASLDEENLKMTLANVAEYKCPTRLLEAFSQVAILDKIAEQNLSYKCPMAFPVIDNVAPDVGKSEILEPPGSQPVAKEAKLILRIRHKKMKKHKLKKLRKRMYFLWRKQKQTRKAKRMAIYNKELEDIKATGEQFNAEEFVRSQLTKARRGGYYINVFESKH